MTVAASPSTSAVVLSAARAVDVGGAAAGDEPPIAIEARLIARARSGDASAFRALFERHAPPLRRFLADLLRDAAAADEATQETFVRAHRGLGSLRDGDRLAPWLFGIARHVFHEELRARRRATPSGDTRLAERPADPAASPESLLLGREADARLAEALATLDEERRAAVVLRVDHGLDYDEIGMVMGWTLAKVKNEIHRGRLALRAALRDYLGGER